MWTPADLRSARRPRGACAREPAVCNLPERCRMDGARAAAPCTVLHRPPMALARAGDPRRHLIRAAHRLRVAAPAAGLPALEHGASLVLAPVAGRRVRAPRSRPYDGRPGPGRTRGQPDRLCHGRASGALGRRGGGRRARLRSSPASRRSQTPRADRHRRPPARSWDLHRRPS